MEKFWSIFVANMPNNLNERFTDYDSAVKEATRRSEIFPDNVFIVMEMCGYAKGSSVIKTEYRSSENPINYVHGGFTILAGSYTELTGEKREVKLENMSVCSASDAGNLYIEIDTGEPKFILSTELSGEETQTMMYLGKLEKRNVDELVFVFNTEISYNPKS